MRECVPAPTRSQFIAAGDETAVAPNRKPFDVGLFTSTATFRGYSGWRTLLDLSRGSSLYPLPWYVWEVEALADASVLEIADAHRWVEFC